MIDPETLNRLVYHACSSADMAAIITARNPDTTPAKVTRAVILATITQLEANGLIEIVDPAAWPETVVTESLTAHQRTYGAS